MAKSSKTQGKPPMHLIPVEALPGVARAMHSSVADGRYEENDWRKPERVSMDFLDAALRHILAEVLDPGGFDEDSGERHVYHVLASVMIYAARTMTNGDPAPVNKALRPCSERPPVGEPESEEDDPAPTSYNAPMIRGLGGTKP